MKRRVVVDSELVDEARRLGGHPTKAAAVEEALREYVRRRAQMRVIDLFGKIDFDPEYDYKAARAGRLPARFEPSDSE